MFIPIKVLVVFYLLIVTTSKVLGKRNKRPEPVQYVTDREAGGALYPYPLYRTPHMVNSEKESHGRMVPSPEEDDDAIIDFSTPNQDGFDVLDIADADGNKIVYIKNFPPAHFQHRNDESQDYFRRGSTSMYHSPTNNEKRPVPPIGINGIQYGYPLTYAVPYPIAFAPISLPAMPLVIPPAPSPAINPEQNNANNQPPTVAENDEIIRDQKDPYFGGPGYPGYPPSYGGGFPGGYPPYGNGYPPYGGPGGYPGGVYPGGGLGGYPHYPGGAIGYPPYPPPPPVGYPGYPGFIPGFYGEGDNDKKPVHPQRPHYVHDENKRPMNDKFKSSPITQIIPATIQRPTPLTKTHETLKKVEKEEKLADKTETKPVNIEEKFTKDSDPKSVIPPKETTTS